MTRRDLFKWAGMLAAGWPVRQLAGFRQDSIQADVVVTGGGVGGCAAALAAARNGLRVVMTEETDWIGGQLTAQAVPPDEHPWIEQFGATQSYRTFRNRVRDYYRGEYPVRGEVYRDDAFNPGGCAVSYLCHEPRAAHSVLLGMMAPYVSAGRLTILTETVPVGAGVVGDRVTTVRVHHVPSGDETELTAPYVIDATETGDLLPLAGAEFVTGAESQAETGELHAPAEAQPHNMQAVTWCFAVDYRPGEDHTIDEPAGYRRWREYVPDLTPPWPGRLLSLTYSHPITLEPRTLDFDPRPGAQPPGFNLWTYRRLVDPSAFEAGAFGSGISLINWPQNDYLEGNLFEVTPETTERHRRDAMDLSLSLLYWLQTEAPRPDGGAGWPGLRLRGDVCGTRHGLAKRPYIRESRRIRAEFTVTEAHVGLEARMAATGLGRDEVTAASFPDSAGIGSYRIDLHPSTGGDNYIDISSLPFEIPFGALIPQRLENLLAGGKNLGVTHITNGCYRLHPVEWNTGETAGLAAVFCLQRRKPPRAVRNAPDDLADFQRFLGQQGVEVRWPRPMQTPR